MSFPYKSVYLTISCCILVSLDAIEFSLFSRPWGSLKLLDFFLPKLFIQRFESVNFYCTSLEKAQVKGVLRKIFLQNK